MKLEYIGPIARSPRLGVLRPGDVHDLPAHNVVSPLWTTDEAALATATAAELGPVAAMLAAETGDKPTKADLVDAIMAEIRDRAAPVTPPADPDVDGADEQE